jgi:predicted dehydrogenase
MAANNLNADLRLAVVGFGEIAQKHIAALRALGANIVAAVNRSPEGRQRAERDGGIAHTYADVAAMVERERPSGILVSTSVRSQFDAIRQLIPFDIPLLIEKPPALSLADWTLLRNAMEARRLPVMMALNRRYYSVYERALERMGGIEAVTSVSVEWSEDPAKMLAVGHPAEILPLLNFANSIHGIDLLTFFAGIVRGPQIWGRNLGDSGQEFRWQMAVDGLTERGARASFTSNWDVPGRWRVVVDATDVRMVSAPLETAVLLARNRAQETIEPSAEDRQFKEGFYAQASAFLQLIRDGNYQAWPMATLDEVSADMHLAELLTNVCQTATIVEA